MNKIHLGAAVMQRIKLILTLTGGIEAPYTLLVGTPFDSEDAIYNLVRSEEECEWWVDANGNAVRVSSVIAVRLA